MTKGKDASKDAKAALLEQAESYLRSERKGQPTHNHDVARALGLNTGKLGAGRLYAWMKDDGRFIFRPDGLPASFKTAPKKRSKAKAAA